MPFHNLLTESPSINLDFLEIDKKGENPNLFPTLCAFLNTEGGYVFIGISRDKEIQGISEAELDDFRKTFIERSQRNKAYLNPPVGFHIEEVKEADALLLLIQVNKSTSVHQSNGRFYKRIRSGTVRLDELHDISKLFLSKREKTEEVILPEITQDDLNLELFDKARAIASTNKSNHMWITMSNEEIIRGSNLVGYDRSSRKYYYNIAAVLLLGKDETITRILPGYKFEIFVRKEDIYRWDDRKTFRTNLIDTRIEALDFITDNLKESYFDEGGQRKDLRDQIFKEIVGNVIIHREYSDAMATEIVISKDSVVSTNPNIIHQSGLLDLDTFEHYPKNPKILGFFKEMGWSEEAGTGVKNVTRYLNIYVRGAVPEFFEDNPFVTTIPLKSHLLGERYIFLLELFDIVPSEFSSDKAALLKEIPIQPDLDEKEDPVEFIVEFIGTLAKNEGELPKFKMLKKNVLGNSSEDFGGSLREIGGELLIKKGRNLLKLLISLVEEMSLEDAMLIAGLEKREGFRVSYLKVLKDSGLISLTIPDRINDPNQKYIISERGKKLLGGMEI